MVIQINQNVIQKTGGVTDNKSENMRETIFGEEIEKIKHFCDKQKSQFFKCFFKKYFPIYFWPKNTLISKKIFYLALYVI